MTEQPGQGEQTSRPAPPGRVPAPARMRRREARELRRAAERDAAVNLPAVVSPGPGLTPTIVRLLQEAAEVTAQLRSEATGQVGALACSLEWTRTEIDRARAARLDTERAAVPPLDLERRRGEADLDDADIRHRRLAEAERQQERSAGDHRRLDAVLADLCGRHAVQAARVRSTVHVAQAAAWHVHHAAVSRVYFYVEHLIQAHASGPALVQAEWPTVPPPAGWVVDGAEAFRVLGAPTGVVDDADV